MIACLTSIGEREVMPNDDVEDVRRRTIEVYHDS